MTISSLNIRYHIDTIASRSRAREPHHLNDKKEVLNYTKPGRPRNLEKLRPNQKEDVTRYKNKIPPAATIRTVRKTLLNHRARIRMTHCCVRYLARTLQRKRQKRRSAIFAYSQAGPAGGQFDGWAALALSARASEKEAVNSLTLGQHRPRRDTHTL